MTTEDWDRVRMEVAIACFANALALTPPGADLEEVALDAFEAADTFIDVARRSTRQ